MHTVFINTTNNKIGSRFDMLKNVKELKKLMCVDCPLETWDTEEQGFKSITRRISDYIDTYNDINNDYNIIIYIDMIEVFEFMDVDFFNKSNVEKEIIRDICKSMIVRLIVSTLVTRLTEIGRTPTEFPLLLLEMPEIKENPKGIDISGQKVSISLDLLNILPMEKLQKKLECIGINEQNALTVEDVFNTEKQQLNNFFYKSYRKTIQTMIDSVCKDGVSLTRACSDLCKTLESYFVSDCARGILVSEYLTNKQVQKLNLEANTKHGFLMQCFILNCVNDKTIFDVTAEGKLVKKIPEISEEKWERIKARLYSKKRIYEIENKKIEKLDTSFKEIGLAPELYKLAREKFGLNESGNISSKYILEKESKKEKKSFKFFKKDKEKSSKQDKLTEQKGVVQNWFKEEYKLYDSEGDEYIPSKDSLLTVDEYCEKAIELANHHLNILNKLNMHVKRTMANYSGRSISNSPALLRKRSVNMGEIATDTAQNDYVYAERNGDKLIIETEPTESVIETSKSSYITIMLEYLKFDAGRGIAIKSIKEQCEWFINRIRQIENVFKKLFRMLVVLFVIVAFIYIPFVVIQWNSITKSIYTILGALFSLSIPFVLLCFSYFIAKLLQKLKMKKIWNCFLEKNKEMIKDNKRIIDAYDKLLTRYIPSLRWLYEYVLDVDFHCDCCNIARAKLNHHREKLFELIEDIANLLEDLDYIGKEEAVIDNDEGVEYTRAFCHGEQNCNYYSIIDKEMLDLIYERKRGLE